MKFIFCATADDFVLHFDIRWLYDYQNINDLITNR